MSTLNESIRVSVFDLECLFYVDWTRIEDWKKLRSRSFRFNFSSAFVNLQAQIYKEVHIYLILNYEIMLLSE